MKVLIVDDEPLARNELHYLLKKNVLINEIDEANGVMMADQKVNANQPDLVFLDIKLDDGNGMALARRWKKLPQPPAIVFATAYDNYAVDAFNEAAVDYILKPFDPERINEAVARVAKIRGTADQAENVAEQAAWQNPRLSITIDDKTMVIQKRDVMYIETQGGYTHLHLRNDKLLISRQTLTSIAQLLNPRHFMRIHRGFIVNLDEIDEMQPSFNHTYELTLKDGSKIPVSRSYVAKTKKAIGLQ
ncbi:LytTR family DNA-binding domain-containing protein [Limosilactobacillus mucosae]|uniref:LytTR family DNA-binding domain-containing protein n=1 Tax=Limosilactobacillus mucosae TaxID=97478 RepID=A0AAJ1MB70_LIMMU|nr:LytTR family DNA-binding domain-containing protein [Limosilactobacillus mucosae]MDC2829799.1 LytTR family DNA-binding domain-containing protein [Limosilactobacillus mucosae]MDC2837255.1 LytTR family DNA-binding domain-containing protein [Limosilactobacillus mucosae]MDC2839957.1 LytTR family DNA-binding domain-containing protein [Limosilactobacillus mucosae]MDC2840685.1 LytTR family DNA-binding domain-containing protein [Limosilactobacillus mucosae]MDC2845965.1 LytTR family DNA-binding domai